MQTLSNLYTVSGWTAMTFQAEIPNILWSHRLKRQDYLQRRTLKCKRLFQHFPTKLRIKTFEAALTQWAAPSLEMSNSHKLTKAEQYRCISAIIFIKMLDFHLYPWQSHFQLLCTYIYLHIFKSEHKQKEKAKLRITAVFEPLVRSKRLFKVTLCDWKLIHLISMLVFGHLSENTIQRGKIIKRTNAG